MCQPEKRIRGGIWWYHRREWTKSIQRSRPRAHVALNNASKQIKAVLGHWETANKKENFYRGIRILLELQRNGSSKL
jgi:hypothetical protein